MLTDLVPGKFNNPYSLEKGEEVHVKVSHVDDPRRDHFMVKAEKGEEKMCRQAFPRKDGKTRICDSHSYLIDND